MSQKARLAKLEAARRAWRATHIPAAEVTAFLSVLLSIVGEEASPAAAERILWRIVAQKAERVEALYLTAQARLKA